MFLVLLSSGAMAQVTGFVESVGVGGKIRPDCWNPLRVNLTSTISDSVQYQLQVWQEDLDKDRVVYSREITLSSKAQERFELYFIPQKSMCNDTVAYIPPGELQKALHVRICLPPGEGKKPDDAKVVVDRLGLNFSVDNLDPPRSGLDWKLPGTRLVLYVTDGSSHPSFGQYAKVPGLAEFAEFVPVHVSDLGENVLFYDSVDTVIWLSGNADELEAAGSHRRSALDQFVRQGGRLVVCQPADRRKIEALGSLLPVETKDSAGNWQITFSEKPHFIDEQKPGKDSPPVDALPWLSQDLGNYKIKTTWSALNPDGKHPIVIARAKPLGNALVELTQYWSKTDKSPYIVRGPHGLGCVTWVAQDLGDMNLNGPDSENWAHVWDHVIGWHNNTVTYQDVGENKDRFSAVKAKRDNESGGDVDLSQFMLQGTDYASKGAAYVILAVFFFIAYWVAAGPGTYLFLSRKKRKELNWFIFGAWAFVGTALTVLLVRLVLRGSAEVKHLTVVRQVVGEPAMIYSRVGLYIPRDGDQGIALDETSKEAISYITPLQEHPQYVHDTDFPASQVYGIPMHDDPQPVSLRVPFRSTLKKLQMRWVGDMPNNVGGTAKLTAWQSAKGEDGVIAGTLTNQTGTDLKDIYFVFNYTARGQKPQDWVLFVPIWKNGKSVDLNAEFSNAKDLIIVGTNKTLRQADPRENGSSSIKAPVDGFGGWGRYWTSWNTANISASSNEESRGKNDFEEIAPKAIPLLSLFDRITPGQNEPDVKNRVDFIRRGGTILNMSSSVAAGRLVVLAQSDSDDKPLPFPFLVEGSRVGGQGRVIYQFALPIDRREMEADAAKGE